MARARIIVLSSPRLARLDALLVASGAPAGQVQRADDAMELFELGPAAGAMLIADLQDVPFADAGLLRRWQESCPGSRILWVGPEGSSDSAFTAAAVRGELLRWPLDVEQLEDLARDQRRHRVPTHLDTVSQDAVSPGTSEPAAHGMAPAPEDLAPAAAGVPAVDMQQVESLLTESLAAESGAAESPSTGPWPTTSTASTTGAGPLEPHDLAADARRALELSEIESILGRDGGPKRGGPRPPLTDPEQVQAPSGMGPLTTDVPSRAPIGQPATEHLAAEHPAAANPATEHPATGRPQSAFLRAATSERPIPVPDSTLRGTTGLTEGLEAHPAVQPAAAESSAGEPHAPAAPEFGSTDQGTADALSLDGPLLTDEEIEAFFSDTDDFVIPAMGPGGHEAPPLDEGIGGSAVDQELAPERTEDRPPSLDGSDPTAEAVTGSATGSETGPPSATEDPTPGRSPGQGSAPALEAPVGEAGPHEESRTRPCSDAAARDSQRPSWLKDQVADLADIVQALDLTARSTHAHLGLERELGHLRQFTRTIGYVAAPPPRGEQEFDLSVLLEEQLGALAGQTPDAPRILFRSRLERATVEADKLLVTMALEALLLTAIGCAGPGDVIRVSIDANDAGAPCAHIRFPAGPMSDLDPTAALQPYALKARLPEIGANALAAAGAIAVGQGGDLVLREEAGGYRVFDVSFSGAPAS